MLDDEADDVRLDDTLKLLIAESAVIVTCSLREECEDPDRYEDDEDTQTISYGWLPRKFRGSYNEDFYTALALCATVVMRKALSPTPETLSCVGEELALRAVIHVATNALSTKEYFWTKGYAKRHLGLTPRKRDRLRERLNDFESSVQEDCDFEFHFDTSKDGIEDDPVVASMMGFANLKLREWFVPFGGADSPSRGGVDPGVMLLAQRWVKWLDTRAGVAK